MQSLLERVNNLQKLCDKKEKFLQVCGIWFYMSECIMMLCFLHGLQSTKMILKFRETHIGNMERGRRGEGREGEGGAKKTGSTNGVVPENGLARIVSGIHTICIMIMYVNNV